MKHHLFTDGGVILSNPSPHGGTYAWCLVRGDEEREAVLIQEHSCLIYPTGKNALITNNYTEMMAMAMALGDLWSSILTGRYQGDNPIIYSDSQLTLERAFGNYPWSGIPDEMRIKVQGIVAALRDRGELNYVLVAGHPTRAQLHQGYKIKKNGSRHPVSKWNVFCDENCSALAKRFVMEMEEKNHGQ